MPDDKATNEILGEQIKLLFSMCGQLIPQKEKLKKVLKLSEKRSGASLAMAPILGAVGVDYEEAHFNAELHRKRAQALFNLVDVLETTEQERAEFKAKLQNKKAIAANLGRALGL